MVSLRVHRAVNCIATLLVVKQVLLESLCLYTGPLRRTVEMRRHHPVPAAFDHHRQLQQSLDLLASVTSPREPQSGGDGLTGSGDRRLTSRWRSIVRRWQSFVYVLFVVSLLFNASVVTVVWWHWKFDECSPHAQLHGAVDHVS